MNRNLLKNTHLPFSLRQIQNDGTGAHVYVFSDTERLQIVWRGTERNSLKDILTDLSILPKRWSYGDRVPGKIHSGFLKSYESVRSILYKECKQRVWEKRPYTIDITGHSMGAALAAINCLDFKESLFKSFKTIIL